MASGDTKTEALLNILGNGGDASSYKGCCNTKTQSYILDAIDRVQNVEDEVEELKNNPDVVDIVDTYADLQAYDTTHLSDNDIIRVLADETHSGNSTYYKFNKQAGTWTFIGEISSGGVKELTSADYNYKYGGGTPDGIALWLLDEGQYTIAANTNYYTSNSSSTSYSGGKVGVIVVKKPTENYSYGYIIYTQGQSSNSYAITGIDENGANGSQSLIPSKVVQTTGTSTNNVMSQNSVTSMMFADPATTKKIKIGNSATTNHDDGIVIGASAQDTTNGSSIAIGPYAKAWSVYGMAIGQNAQVGTVNGQANSRLAAVAIGSAAHAEARNSVGIGYGSLATAQGEMNIGEQYGTGYNNSVYRLLTGLYDPQTAHDAATKGYVDTRLSNLTITTISQSDYDNLQTKDPDTLYVITGA